MMYGVIGECPAAVRIALEMESMQVCEEFQGDCRICSGFCVYRKG